MIIENSYRGCDISTNYAKSLLRNQKLPHTPEFVEIKKSQVLIKRTKNLFTEIDKVLGAQIELVSTKETLLSVLANCIELNRDGKLPISASKKIFETSYLSFKLQLQAFDEYQSSIVKKAKCIKLANDAKEMLKHYL